MKLPQIRRKVALKAIASLVAAVFSLTTILPASPAGGPPAYAQALVPLPAPGVTVTPSTGFSPAIITGMISHPENPFQFDFIVDTGDDRLKGDALKKESAKLVNYFMAALTIPEDQMWVNLSPYEENRIIADGLAKTEMGRDMLSQDYILKQFAASLLFPEGKVGEAFWRRVWKKVGAPRHGGAPLQDMAINTVNKVWIVPEEAKVSYF